MTWISNGQPAIIRTERGLTIAGTRITLYDVMDYLKAEYPSKFIRDTFNLTDAQLGAVLSYIETHQRDIEAEYQGVLKVTEEIHDYWKEYNRERFAQIPTISERTGYETVRSKLQERKAQREAQK
ncbi:DUF433 domain-containing protein [Gloeocapsa sp. PCC 73106]|uniref:DUF433 domain-containing protein n=1 Tax=Gloeocapsa sp. PCC 73106 TaxID=102232 RepID=UPI0002ACC2CA|nr:DUF433 domain-containing protein [Gloeocapsa sp. PCC 73106]ELR98554.1 Protein of unknown function (DUF433) [Gloeocapsa sp. PCC 73106]